MKITKKIIEREIERKFSECSHDFFSFDGYSLRVSVWGRSGLCSEGNFKDLLKILHVVDGTDWIDSSWGVYRQVGCYESTDDITMDFSINKKKLKKFLSE